MNQSSDEEDAGSTTDIEPQDGELAVSIVPQSRMKGFVLFAVYGGQRLRPGRLGLAQIDIRRYSDDDSFFTEMAVQYKRLRGFFRWHFSIYKFHACSFNRVRLPRTDLKKNVLT